MVRQHVGNKPDTAVAIGKGGELSSTQDLGEGPYT